MISPSNSDMFLKNMNPLLDSPTVSPKIQLLDKAEEAFQKSTQNVPDQICKLSEEFFSQLEREQTKRVLASFATALIVGGVTALCVVVSPVRAFSLSSLGMGALLMPSLGEDCADIDNTRKQANVLLKICGAAQSRIDRLKGKQDFLKKNRGTGERERAETELAITEIQKKIIKYQTLVDQQSTASVPEFNCFFSFSPPSKTKAINDKLTEIVRLALSMTPTPLPYEPGAPRSGSSASRSGSDSGEASIPATATTATTTSTSLNVTIPTTPKDGPKIVFTEK